MVFSNYFAKFCFATLALVPFWAFAQTNLDPGNVVLTYVGCDDNRIQVLLLTDWAPGTELCFTDAGFDGPPSDAFFSGESYCCFAFTAGYPAGTEIQFRDIGSFWVPSIYDPATGITVSLSVGGTGDYTRSCSDVGTGTTSNDPSLSVFNDEVFLFQGNIVTGAGLDVLAAVTPTPWDAVGNTAGTSKDPSAIITGGQVISHSSNQDNALFVGSNCPPANSTQAAALAPYLLTGNYSFSSSAPTSTYPSCPSLVFPVTWGDVSAKRLAAGVEISWSTLSEQNNSVFTIERSDSLLKWAQIGQVPGAGTTTSANGYSWFDEFPLHGAAYYRIRQTDYDGTSTYSPVIHLQADLNQEEFSVVPNPIRSGQKVKLLGLDNTSPIQVEVYSTTGKIVHPSWLAGSPDDAQQRLEEIFSAISPGVYYIKFNTPRTLAGTRLVVTN